MGGYGKKAFHKPPQALARKRCVRLCGTENLRKNDITNFKNIIMKQLFIICLLFTTILSLSQTKTATTEDGKIVILKSDGTWQYSEKIESKRKITLEFIHKDQKKQFQVIYDAPDSNMVNSGNQISGFYNSGWKKSIYVEKMENQITFKVATVGMGSETVTLNIYVDDKIAKTITEKAKNLLQGPATLTIDLADFK